jgi:hypothetical protein
MDWWAIFKDSVQGVPFKTQPNNNHVLYGTKMESEAGPLPCNTLPTSRVTFESRSPWLLGRCLRHLSKSYAGANTLYSRAERVLIIAVSNITLHRNRLLLFVKHWAMRVPTRKYRIRQQYFWLQNFWAQEVYNIITTPFCTAFYTGIYRQIN